jgi:gliding motility-associated-like protein/uncharacterized repeat protein (TIGR01451 family)
MNFDTIQYRRALKLLVENYFLTMASFKCHTINFLNFLFFSLLFLYSGQSLLAQTQPPSITSGVTFQWDGPQPTASSPANLLSITVDDKVFDQFAIPSSYELTRLGVNGHNQNRIIENGVVVETSSSSASWEASALAAFSSTNFNFKFESDGNGRNFCGEFDLAATTDAQMQTLFYDDLQIVNSDALIGIATRNANSCIYIEVIGSESLGGPEVVLGSFFARPGPTIFGDSFGPPAASADYWRSGRVNSNNGNIGIALFNLEEVAPLGAYVTGIRYVGASNNHGDGKVFMIRTSSIDLSISKEASNPNPNRGDIITLSTTAVNNGPLNATGVQVIESLGTGFVVVTSSATVGSFNSFTGIWNIGNLAYNQTATLNIQVIVNETGEYVNSAEITPTANDPNLENNVASVSAQPANVIVANDLVLNSVANSGNVGNVISNDLINNNPITIDNVTITSVDASNPLVTIDVETGEVTVGSVPSGTYTIDYTICENDTDPINSNCAFARVTVEILNAIQANEDIIYSNSNNPNAGNIFQNNENGEDSINGEAITIEEVNITSVTSSNPSISIDTDNGNISIGEVSIGSYTLEYTICEKGTNPLDFNCSTAMVTVIVQRDIEAKDDLITSSGNTPDAGNIFADNGNGEDLLDGDPANLTNVNITLIEPSNPLVTVDSSTGSVTIGNVASGTYTIEYTICEDGTDTPNTNCSTATVTVEIENIIQANDDEISSTANNPNSGNIFENNGNGDDSLNGEPVSIGSVNIQSISPSNPLVTIDDESGNIIVGNVPSGVYTIEYTICEDGTDPQYSNCSTAIVTVEVQNTILAKDDVISSIANNPNAGNILENNGDGADLLNDDPVSVENVNISLIETSNPLVDLDLETGVISVGNLPTGTYTITYSICEKDTDPSDINCSTATVTLTVQSEIIANDDFVSAIANNPTAGNIFEDNGNGEDLLNGEPATIALVNISLVEASNPLVTIDINSGNIVVGNVPTGVYTINYTICEEGSANSNCSSAMVMVEVQNLIQANDDFIHTEANTPNVGNVLEDNGNGEDMLNGGPATLDNVSISSVEPSNPLVTLDPTTGIISVGDVGEGTYSIAYTICETAESSANCSTATVTVVIGPIPNVIQALDDLLIIEFLYEGVNAVINILANDTFNGNPLSLDEVLLFVNGSEVEEEIPLFNGDDDPNPLVILRPNGDVIISFGILDGTYTLTYRICDASDPANCDSATLTIVVDAGFIQANDDVFGPIDGITGGNTGSIYENDLLNGVNFNPSDVLTTVISIDPELTLNEDGTITVSPNTAPGEYNLVYQICGFLIPDRCDMGFVTVEVITGVDMAIQKTSDEVEIWTGDNFDYVIRVFNQGGTEATEVVVEDLLPEGISFKAQEIVSNLNGLEVQFDKEERKLVWMVSSFPADAMIEIKLTVSADAFKGKDILPITNAASVQALEVDFNLDNNFDSDVNQINLFFIPNVITPNGNGYNDTFQIKGLNKFVSNNIVIFNRNGDHVFETEDYKNDWDAPGLTPDTYYYIFRTTDKNGKIEEFNGWIKVIRK